MSSDAVDWLVRYDYPGNVRELRNILERAIAISQDGVISQEHLMAPDQDFYRRTMGNGNKNATGSATGHVDEATISLAEMQAQQIDLLMHKFDGNRRRVATALGISERTLYRKLGKSAG
jgi:DNA-binding NtrC family response regulator